MRSSSVGGCKLLGSLQDSGSESGSVASANSDAGWNHSHECPAPSVHRDEDPWARCRRIVMDGFLLLGRGWVLADRGSPCFRRIRCDVLRVVVLVGSGAVGEQAVRLQPEELGPGRADPAWCRAEAALAKHRGDGGVRDVDPELHEFAPDPEVSAPRVLPTQPTDQLLDRGIEGRTTGPAARASRTPPQELSVPSEEGVRADQEAPPPVPGEQSGRRGQQRPIGGGKARSRSSSSENLQLASEHDRLEIALINATADEQTEQ